MCRILTRDASFMDDGFSRDTEYHAYESYSLIAPIECTQYVEDSWRTAGLSDYPDRRPSVHCVVVRATGQPWRKIGVSKS